MSNVVSSCVRDDISDTLLMQNEEEESIWPMRKRFLYYLQWITVDSKHVYGNATNPKWKKSLSSLYMIVFEKVLVHEPAAYKELRQLSVAFQPGMKNIYHLSRNRTAGIHSLITGKVWCSPTILHFCSVLWLPKSRNKSAMTEKFCFLTSINSWVVVAILFRFTLDASPNHRYWR